MVPGAVSDGLRGGRPATFSGAALGCHAARGLALALPPPPLAGLDLLPPPPPPLAGGLGATRLK